MRERERERESYLQESLIDNIEDPFLPMMYPIFPGGTLSTDRISSSGPFPSTMSESNRTSQISAFDTRMG